MTEHHHLRLVGRHGDDRHPRRRRRTAKPDNFYREVIAESETSVLAEAASVDGLGGEVAMLRVLVRRQMAEHPERLDLTIQALHLLVRMVATHYRLSGADAEQLREEITEAVGQIARSVLGEEVDDA